MKLVIRSRTFALIVRSLGFTLCIGAGGGAWASTGQNSAALADVMARTSALSLPFVPNAGQWDESVAYRAQTFAGDVWVTHSADIIHRFASASSGSIRGNNTQADAALQRTTGRLKHAAGWVLAERLIGAIPRPIDATDRQPGLVSYVTGDAARTVDNLPAFGQLDLGEVLPGISLRLQARGSNVEKIYTVAARADPSAIRMRVDGALDMRIEADGSLALKTGLGEVSFTAPVAYQDIRGGRKPVPVAYALDAQRGHYGFKVGEFDRDVPLVIDPLLQSTYLGGSGNDTVTAMAIHPTTGDVYVTGYTGSPTFPKTAGAEQTVMTPGGTTGYDAFVTRLNAALTVRLQSTYLGGNGDDQAFGIAIHPASGEIYIAGATQSNNFPKTANSEQPTLSATSNAFVTRLNAALTSRIQSTYVGGTCFDTASAIAIHPTTGDVYITGNTCSNDIPKLAGGTQTTMTGIPDGFITRLNAALTTRIQSTLFGGLGQDFPLAIAIHPFTGHVYIGGYTSSADLPWMAGGAQPVKGTGDDGFIAQFDASLTGGARATFLGATGGDYVTAIAIHPKTGDVYAAGWTQAIDFPKTFAGIQPTFSAGGSLVVDAFVSRVTPTLTAIIQSTYLGGNQDDFAQSIVINPATGHLYVAGYTSSGDFGGVIAGAQNIKSTGTDVFAVWLGPGLISDGTEPFQSTYLGGSATDTGAQIAVHPTSGEVYVAGQTSGTGFPGAGGSEQTTLAGGSDAFVARFTPSLRVADDMPNPFTFAPQVGALPGSVRTSAPVVINGLGVPVGVVVSGTSPSQYCISSTNSCTCNVLSYRSTMSGILNGQFLCVRHAAAPVANALRESIVTVGGYSTRFSSYTGSDLGTCNLDIDGNGGIDALTDGLLILRAMFGLTGTQVTNTAVGAGATRATWAAVRAFLNGSCGGNFAP